MGKNYSHLTYHDRLRIEVLHKAGHSITRIASLLGVSYPTIWREIKVRGIYDRKGSCWEDEEGYSPEISQKKYEEGKKMHGKGLKIGNDMDFVRYVEAKILNEKCSPEAVLYYIKREGLQFRTNICRSTLYNYIREGVFLNVTMKDLPMPRNSGKRKRKKKRVQKRASAGVSIEKRPESVNLREEIGHWEMDTVVGPSGKSKKSLLVLTERKSLFQIIEVLQNHTDEEVVRALDRLEREGGEKWFRETFRSITVDNGSEFSDVKGMERSRRNKKNRTQIYYCHAYRSYERARNENQNRFVRRIVPKGTVFDDITRKEVKQIQEWMNDYPRPMFNGESARDVFLREQEKRAVAS